MRGATIRYPDGREVYCGSIRAAQKIARRESARDPGRHTVTRAGSEHTIMSSHPWQWTYEGGEIVARGKTCLRELAKAVSRFRLSEDLQQYFD